MARELSTYTSSATPLVTTAETAAITSDPYTAPTDGAKYIISGTLGVTAGTATTSHQIRCRRGVGTGGTQVGATLNHTTAAGNTDDISYNFTDFPGAVAGQQYTITVQQVAATGNGSVTSAAVSVTSDA